MVRFFIVQKEPYFNAGISEKNQFAQDSKDSNVNLSYFVLSYYLASRKWFIHICKKQWYQAAGIFTDFQLVFPVLDCVGAVPKEVIEFPVLRMQPDLQWESVKIKG